LEQKILPKRSAGVEIIFPKPAEQSEAALTDGTADQKFVAQTA